MASKKLVIHAINRYFTPVTAGIEVNMHKTYERIVVNHEVTVHASRNTLDTSNILGEEDVLSGINVKRYVLQPWGYWPKIDWNLIDVLALHNFYILPHSFLLIYAGIMKMLGIKKFAVILTPHGGFTPEWSVFPGLTRIVKRAYHYTIGVWLINWAVDGIRTVSEWERREMVKTGVRDSLIRVISNGVEDDAFEDIEKLASVKMRNLVEKWGSYIIQIGRVYPIKNYETTIKALARLPEHINYVIMGPVEKNAYPEYFSTLESLIKQLGLEKRVHFVGVVTGFDKYYAIRHSLMMVHMAIWESFCNVVHEGMSQGKICVVADNTALKYLVKDGVTGYRIETYDSEALANKINYVLENFESGEVKSIVRNSLSFGRETSWRMVAKSMEQFYMEKWEKINS